MTCFRRTILWSISVFLMSCCVACAPTVQKTVVSNPTRVPEYLLTPLEMPEFIDSKVTVGALLVHAFALEGLVDEANERFEHIRRIQEASSVDEPDR